MIEIKTWEAKDKHTLRKRLHQYSTMCNASACGADCFYLVLWRWKGKEEWRLYPVLDLTESNGGIVFWRDKGYYVPGEVPDWLNAYASSFRR